MAQADFHQNFLEYRNYRYFKLALLLCAGSVIAYLRDAPVLGPYGGTRLGYILGTIGAVLIVWLLWFGIRKRRYKSRVGTLQGWLSAHVYLGASLLVVATLHTGFQAGWNVHTLAYALMVIVILSGCYGVYAYARFPKFITQAMGEDSVDSLLLKIVSQDAEARKVAMNLSDEINRIVMVAAEKTRVGGSVLAQLRGDEPQCPTTRAVEAVRQAGAGLKGAEARVSNELFMILLHKQSLLRRARQGVMYKARLDLWLYAHVPLSIALLGALTAHIVSVFFYRG